MSRIQPTIQLKDSHDCDLVIEAIPENMQLKIKLYKELGITNIFLSLNYYVKSNEAHKHMNSTGSMSIIYLFLAIYFAFFSS